MAALTRAVLVGLALRHLVDVKRHPGATDREDTAQKHGRGRWLSQVHTEVVEAVICGDAAAGEKLPHEDVRVRPHRVPGEDARDLLPRRLRHRAVAIW